MQRILSATLLFAALPLLAQQSEAPAVPEVHVDEHCRVLTQDRFDQSPGYTKPRFRPDDSICHVDASHLSHHWEQNVENGVVKRTYVTVLEHEFLLHDFTDKPVRFIVEQPVPKGWRIDSDPPPTSVDNRIAFFTVDALPGQTVRVHIGERKN